MVSVHTAIMPSPSQLILDIVPQSIEEPIMAANIDGAILAHSWGRPDACLGLELPHLLAWPKGTCLSPTAQVHIELWRIRVTSR
jgi:hypothetical protein